MYSKIFNMAFSTIFNKYIYLIKALLIYTMISIGIDYINLENIVYIDGKAQVQSVFVSIIIAILSFLIYTMVAITTHRILILGENSIPTWGLFKFTKREWSFIINWFLIGLIIFGILILGMLLGLPFGKENIINIILVIFVIIFLIFISRVSLVFPSIAVDKEITLSEAWVFTKNYKLLMFVAVIVFPSLFALIFGFVYGLAIEFLARLSGLNLFFLESILGIFITVFTISALSATYKQVLEEHPEYFTPQSEKDTTLRDTVIEKSQNSYTIKIHDKQDYSFLQLKDEIHLQFFDLGFDETVVDKEDVWMIRNNQEEIKPYVSLTYTNDEYIIEGFKAPMVNFLN